jgi:hypothetical protein
MFNNKMNIWNIGYFIFTTALLAAIIGFDGKVTLDMTPFRLRVIVDGHPTHYLHYLVDPDFQNSNQDKLKIVQKV